MSTKESMSSEANTVFIFLFLFAYRLKEKKSENFFCCLNTHLITIYTFTLVQNKETIFLLLTKLTPGSLHRYWQQLPVNQVPDHVPQRVLAVCAPPSCKSFHLALRSTRQLLSLGRCGSSPRKVRNVLGIVSSL